MNVPMICDGVMALKRPAVVDFAELLPAGSVIKADADGMFYDVTPGDDLIVGSIDRGSQTILTGPFELLFETRFPEGHDKPIVEFRVAPMADPIIHFAHGVWYRIEVVDGAPTIRPLPPEE